MPYENENSSNLVVVVVVEQTDLHLSHQVSPLMVVSLVELVGEPAEPVLGAGQQIRGLLMRQFDFLCEVSLL